MACPARIVAVDGIAGTADTGERIDLSLVGDIAPGTWVLTFLGAAREVITETDAVLIQDALDGLARVMAGGTAGDAFADIDARAPSLPPHLEAARAAGKATA